MNKPQLSRFLRTVSREGRTAIFHLLHPRPIYLNIREYNEVVSGNFEKHAETVRDMRRERLIIEQPADDESELREYRLRALRFLARPSLYLMLAQECNNTCTYCPIPALATRFGSDHLSFEKAVAGIELFIEHVRAWEAGGDDGKPFPVIFYGGEPLLNQEVLEKLLIYISASLDSTVRNKLQLFLITNGRLMTAELAELLSRNKVVVAVGLDGTPALNDRTRVANSGEGTSIEVERGISLLRMAGIDVAVSMTLTPEIIDAIDENTSHLLGLGVTYMGFNLLKGNALREKLGSISLEQYYQSAARAVLSTRKFSGVREYQLEKKIDALRNGLPFSLDCTCYGGQLVIQPNGDVTNCPFLRESNGAVTSLPKDFRIWDSPTVREWQGRIPLLQTTDEPQFLHGGGCAWSSHELGSATSLPDSTIGTFTSALMKELIWSEEPNE